MPDASLPPHAILLCKLILRLNDRDRLDFNDASRPRKIGDGYKSAARTAPLGKILGPDLDKPIAIPRVVNEDGHCHYVLQVSTDPLQGAPDQLEYRARLRLELARNIIPVKICKRGLPGKPNRSPAFSNDRG